MRHFGLYEMVRETENSWSEFAGFVMVAILATIGIVALAVLFWIGLTNLVVLG